MSYRQALSEAFAPVAPYYSKTLPAIFLPLTWLILTHFQGFISDVRSSSMLPYLLDAPLEIESHKGVFTFSIPHESALIYTGHFNSILLRVDRDPDIIKATSYKYKLYGFIFSRKPRLEFAKRCLQFIILKVNLYCFRVILVTHNCLKADQLLLSHSNYEELPH